MHVVLQGIEGITQGAALSICPSHPSPQRAPLIYTSRRAPFVFGVAYFPLTSLVIASLSDVSIRHRQETLQDEYFPVPASVHERTAVYIPHPPSTRPQLSLANHLASFSSTWLCLTTCRRVRQHYHHTTENTATASHSTTV